LIGFLAAPLARWLVIGAVIAGLSGALYWQIRSSGRLAAERDQAIQAAADNAKEVDRQKGYAAAANTAVAERDATIRQERLKSDEFQRRLRNVKDNCILDPNLAGIVSERLWGANGNAPKTGTAK
jgi:uncharacterized protein HemX